MRSMLTGVWKFRQLAGMNSENVIVISTTIHKMADIWCQHQNHHNQNTIYSRERKKDFFYRSLLCRLSTFGFLCIILIISTKQTNDVAQCISALFIPFLEHFGRFDEAVKLIWICLQFLKCLFMQYDNECTLEKKSTHLNWCPAVNDSHLSEFSSMILISSFNEIGNIVISRSAENGWNLFEDFFWKFVKLISSPVRNCFTENVSRLNTWK